MSTAEPNPDAGWYRRAYEEAINSRSAYRLVVRETGERRVSTNNTRAPQPIADSTCPLHNNERQE